MKSSEFKRAKDISHPAVLVLAAALVPISDPASADPGSQPPPPHSILADQKGIDLLSGRRIGVDSEIKIGPSDSPVLQLSEGFGQGLSGTPVGGFHYTDGAYPNFSDFFVLGARGETDRFTDGGARYLPDGAYETSFFTGTTTLIEKDGTRWNFASTGYQSPAADGYLTSVVKPDGEVLTYTYSTVPGGSIAGTLASIKSSAGYQMNFQWVSQTHGYRLAKVTLTNRRYAYCDPLSGACTGTYNWPNISWALDASGNKTATTSGLRSVTYGAPQQGPQVGVGPTNTGPIYEWNSTVTSATGTQETYTNRYQNISTAAQPLYFGRPLGTSTYSQCVDESNVWRVQDSAGTWVYNYPYQSSNYAWATTCGGVTRTDPLSKQLNRSGGSVLDELGRTTSYTFLDQWNAVSSPTSPIADLRYPTSQTLPEGNKVSWSYDSLFNVIATTLAPKPGSTQALTWSAHFPSSCHVWSTAFCGEPDYTIDARGKRTDYTYDSVHGGVLTKTGPADANGVRPQMRYTYSQHSARVLNAAGALVSESPIWKLDSTSSCRTQASCAGTADEVITSYTYDDNLLPVGVTVKSGDGTLSATSTKTYDEFGNVASEDGPLPGSQDTTVYKYDPLRRLTATMGPDPDGSTGPLPVPVTRTTYNGDGQPTLVETGTAADQTDAALAAMSVSKSVAFEYDTRGLKSKQTVLGSDGVATSLVQYSYDPLGRLECTAQRMNPAVYASLPVSACTAGATSATYGPDRISKNVYDSAGQLVQSWEGVGTSDAASVSTRQYTPNGKLNVLIDANGNRAELKYDPFDRLSCWRFPSPTQPSNYDPSTISNALTTAGATPGDCVSSGDFELYGYDANGNRTSLRKRDGLTLTYAYDDLNRVISKTVPERTGLSTTHTRDVFYKYDLRGLLTESRFGSLTGVGISNSYDTFGRLTSSTNTVTGFTQTLNYQYDASGRRIGVQHPDGDWFTTTRDTAGRPTNVYEGNAATFDSNTVLLRFNYNSDGTLLSQIWGSGSLGAGQTFTFDPVQRATRIANNLPGTANDIALNLAWNPANQIVSQARGNDLYAWNGAANVDRSYNADGLNRYSNAGSATYCYDADGNVTADGTSVYLYDIENRLVEKRQQTSTTCPSATAGYTGTLQASLFYDTMGRLYQSSGITTGTTNFLYDGDELVGEFNNAGAMLKRYIHGDAADDPAVQYTGTGLGYTNRDWLLDDHQGSIIAVSGGDASLKAINRYDEYGIPAAANVGRFQYTGQAWIPDLGMYYYKARIYSPTLGRFLQTDPVGYDGGINLYAYAGDDPVNRSDPSGLLACDSGSAKQYGYDCKEFYTLQKKVADQVLAFRKALVQLANDVKSGNPLNKADKATAAKLDKYMGAGTSGSYQKMAYVNNVLANAERELRSTTGIARFYNGDPDSPGGTLLGSVVLTGTLSTTTILHETVHYGTAEVRSDHRVRFIGDLGNVGSYSGYGSVEATLQRASYGWTYASRSAASYAWLVTGP